MWEVEGLKEFVDGMREQSASNAPAAQKGEGKVQED